MDITEIRQRKIDIEQTLCSLQSEYQELTKLLIDMKNEEAMERFKVWDPKANDCFLFVYPDVSSVWSTLLEIFIVDTIDEDNCRINGTIITYKYEDYTPVMKCERDSIRFSHLSEQEKASTVYKMGFESIKDQLNDLVTLSVDFKNIESFLSNLVSHSIKTISE